MSAVARRLRNAPIARAYRPRCGCRTLSVVDADKVPRKGVPPVDLSRVERKYRNDLQEVVDFTSALVEALVFPQLDDWIPEPDEGEDEAPTLEATDAERERRSTVSELDAEIKRLQKRIADTKKELQALKNPSLEDEIAISNRIKSLKKEIAKTKRLIKNAGPSIDTKIKRIKDEIADTKREIKKAKSGAESDSFKKFSPDKRKRLLAETERIRKLSDPLVDVDPSKFKEKKLPSKAPTSKDFDESRKVRIPAPEHMFKRWVVQFVHNGRKHVGTVVDTDWSKDDRTVHYTWQTNHGKVVTIGVPPGAVRMPGFERKDRAEPSTGKTPSKARKKNSAKTPGAKVPEAERIDKAAEVLQFMRDAVHLNFAGESVRLASRTGATAQKAHKPQQARQLKASVGIDVFEESPKIPEIVSGFTYTNVQLIKSIPRDQLDRVEALVFEAVRIGRSKKDLAADIEKEFGVSENRAILIARDQIGKIQADLSKSRQVANGVTHAVWRDSDDERVRKRHAAFDGRVFEWSKGLDGVFPGQEVGCRCDSEPIL